MVLDRSPERRDTDVCDRMRQPATKAASPLARSRSPADAANAVDAIREGVEPGESSARASSWYRLGGITARRSDANRPCQSGRRLESATAANRLWCHPARAGRGPPRGQWQERTGG